MSRMLIPGSWTVAVDGGTSVTGMVIARQEPSGHAFVHAAAYRGEDYFRPRDITHKSADTYRTARINFMCDAMRQDLLRCIPDLEDWGSLAIEKPNAHHTAVEGISEFYGALRYALIGSRYYVRILPVHASSVRAESSARANTRTDAKLATQQYIRGKFHMIDDACRRYYGMTAAQDRIEAVCDATAVYLASVRIADEKDGLRAKRDRDKIDDGTRVSYD